MYRPTVIYVGTENIIGCLGNWIAITLLDGPVPYRRDWFSRENYLYEGTPCEKIGLKCAGVCALLIICCLESITLRLWTHCLFGGCNLFLPY